MTRNLQLSPFFVGFEDLFDRLETATMQATQHSYPPYSVVKTGDHTYSIELAVAGFAEEDINIVAEDRKLKVSAETKKDEREYMHKGVSTKGFNREFVLAENVQVLGASLVNGILSVSLEVVVPEEKKPKNIPITTIGQPQLLVE